MTKGNTQADIPVANAMRHQEVSAPREERKEEKNREEEKIEERE